MSWNCQGAGKPQFLTTLAEWMRQYKPAIVVIVEPRISGHQADRVIHRLGFSRSYRVDARGFAGGIWLLWMEERVDVSVVFCHTQFIHARVTNSTESFFLTVVYGSPHEKWHKYLWSNLEVLAPGLSAPWVLLGDFNAVLAMFHLEKRWKACKAGQIAGQFGIEQFPNSSIVHLPFLSSDHCPILLHTTQDGRCGSQPRLFRFQSSWVAHLDFKEFVADAWVPKDDVIEAAGVFVDRVKIWNQQVFSNIHIKKKKLLARLAGIQRYLEVKPSKFLSDLETELRLEMESILMQEELLWMQKSKSRWLKAWNRNTAFFHASAKVKARRSKILMLQGPDKEWITEPEARALAVQYFQKLFSEEVSLAVTVSAFSRAVVRSFWSRVEVAAVAAVATGTRSRAVALTPPSSPVVGKYRLFPLPFLLALIWPFSGSNLNGFVWVCGGGESVVLGGRMAFKDGGCGFVYVVGGSVFPNSEASGDE
ncbi:hypothetical protein Tsubulata_018168 [Turnera subulata]|uniref:Endonuclease/exonuclease/phosphatase domain-containing protein n=1 Tax=Turnera subulata TaxID=218843 RepID=A0A9Q0FBU2_9ROSI|nr:hypothetical protein Tsubulata_018168 [Turnera subulata]